MKKQGYCAHCHKAIHIKERACLYCGTPARARPTPAGQETGATPPARAARGPTPKEARAPTDQATLQGPARQDKPKWRLRTIFPLHDFEGSPMQRQSGPFAQL